MARQLFVDETLNKNLEDKVLQSLHLEPSDFRESMTAYLREMIKSSLENVAHDKMRSGLYFIGSFARGLGGVGSDLDLLFLSPDPKTADSLNTHLRKIFNNYSLRTADSVEDYILKSDPKGLLSGWFLEPVFTAPNVREDFVTEVLKKRKNEILIFLKSERESRQKRFGKRPGRVHFNIKQSPGGLVDLRQLDFFLTGQKEKPEDLKTAENFIYKIRNINHFFSLSDSLQVSQIKNYKKYFSKETDRDFYQSFFWSVNVVFEHLCAYKDSLKTETKEAILKSAGLEMSKVELASACRLLEEIRGLVLAPSYHTWTADEHTLKAVCEARDFAREYGDEFSLTHEEIQVLLWSAFFHDIKKGHNEPHSILGAQAVQQFGGEHGWSSKRTEMVSWLVREHLTLVKYSFKSDPFEPEFLRTLALRGCSGRKAVLLFLLSCADLRATNPSSWSEWKRRVLKQALGQILGEENKLKNELVQSLSEGSPGEEVAQKLRLREICLVPFELLKRDLMTLNEEGVCFFDYDGKIWVRSYQKLDESRYAKRFLEGLYLSGAYVQHALFKTIEEGIYNWACVEAGVSLQAFEKRFFMMLSKYEESDAGGPISLPDYKFRKISLNFLKTSYAVVSFKGEDKKGALFEALRILAAYRLNIEWGHAVTWGDEIEDVFGVSFENEPNWSFLL